jgi:probable F420-dependent oxidoreductase
MPPVRFSFAESMIDPAFYLPLARAAEVAGYDSMVVPESIMYPKASDTTYPYVDGGNRDFLEDKPFLDPFSLIPAMGAVTTRLRFVTFVVKLPVRSPVLAAKQAATVAVMTDNRLALGVGLSPWPEDYAACGQPWPERGRRMDEQIDIISGLCEGGYFEYHGDYYDLAPIKICPTPTERVPILVGGHSGAALERAARCDGWLHAGTNSEHLADTVGQLLELRRRLDRPDEPFEVHVLSLDAYSVDGCKRLEDLGVTDVIVGFRDPYHRAQDTEPLQVKIDAVNQYAEAVIARCNA